ncbi:hypothetical protein HED55_15940 [Ochrobactrum haematophilum]|uniref:Uncharacterized protein n=1 Tax=Brucella haematophila TaxID=419474 RepID=A0ABX1DMJ8_9HYPH|nr:hypothetical protein [Brucella haematophila]
MLACMVALALASPVNWRLVMTGAMTTGIITTTISLLSGTIMIFITIMTMQVLP